MSLKFIIYLTLNEIAENGEHIIHLRMNEVSMTRLTIKRNKIDKNTKGSIKLN